MSELAAVDTWLYATLSGDETLQSALGIADGTEFVFDQLGGPDSAFPVVVFEMQSRTEDWVTVNGTRILVTALYLVRAVDQTDSFATKLWSADDRIDVLLQRQTGSNDYGAILSCVREKPFKLIEVDNGIQYRHLGGFYRIQVQEA